MPTTTKTNLQISNLLYGLLVLLLLITSVFWCSAQIKDLPEVNILDAKEQSIKISDIAESIQYIPLNGNAVLGQIRKVAYTNEAYYVKDDNSLLFRFNNNGLFLNKLGQSGRGPAEYRYAIDFCVHPGTGKVYVVSDKKGQLMVFSSEGKFLGSNKHSDNEIFNLGFTVSDLLLFYFNGAEHINENFELLGTEGQVIKSFTNKYKFNRGDAVVKFPWECLMYTVDQTLHLKEIFSDTIFTMKNQNMIPKFILNTGERGFTPEVRYNFIKELSTSMEENETSVFNRSIVQKNLFETSGYLFYNYEYDQKENMLVFNKTNGKIGKVDAKIGMENDWDGGPNIMLRSTRDDNTVFSWIDAYALKAHIESKEFKNSNPKYPEKKKELEELAKSLSENDNPVLILLKLN